MTNIIIFFLLTLSQAERLINTQQSKTNLIKHLHSIHSILRNLLDMNVHREAMQCHYIQERSTGTRTSPLSDAKREHSGNMIGHK